MILVVLLIFLVVLIGLLICFFTIYKAFRGLEAGTKKQEGQTLPSLKPSLGFPAFLGNTLLRAVYLERLHVKHCHSPPFVPDPLRVEDCFR